MTSDKVRRTCRKNDPNWYWPCSCDRCASAAAAAWTADMGRVFAGEITLEEANRRADLRADPTTPNTGDQ